eukprot:867661_1
MSSVSRAPVRTGIRAHTSNFIVRALLIKLRSQRRSTVRRSFAANHKVRLHQRRTTAKCMRVSVCVSQCGVRLRSNGGIVGGRVSARPARLLIVTASCFRAFLRRFPRVRLSHARLPVGLIVKATDPTGTAHGGVVHLRDWVARLGRILASFGIYRINELLIVSRCQTCAPILLVIGARSTQDQAAARQFFADRARIRLRLAKFAVLARLFGFVPVGRGP